MIYSNVMAEYGLLDNAALIQLEKDRLQVVEMVDRLAGSDKELDNLLAAIIALETLTRDGV